MRAHFLAAVAQQGDEGTQQSQGLWNLVLTGTQHEREE